MYERFTERTRKVMQLANQAAQRCKHQYIGTEHVLLGLIEEGSGVAANVLRNLDVDLRKIRLGIEREVGWFDIGTTGRLPQLPRAKRLIEHSMEESRDLNHDYVGTEHLLLGLLREPETPACRVLMNLGLTLDEVRQEVVNLLGHLRIRPKAEQAPSKAEIQDLPDALRSATADFDGEIRRLRLEKEEAVADQQFDLAARLRDQAHELERRKREVIHDWMVNRPIEASWLSFDEEAVAKLA
ncbi:MAG TPA: Clp protease N-terminal domain-containing protein, partial [Pirellulales bacterium]|nr:Clp protease N-terminal domain-containing protein [Pirellulales bacterium]